MMKCNYHTHTKRCHHAYGEDEEYVLSAIENGYDILGFADHVPWKYKTNHKSSMRMDIEQMDDYVNSILSLKEKYKDKIEILLGAECEYYPEYMDGLKELIKKYKLDYIIFGNHFYLSNEYPNSYYGRNCNEDIYLDRYLEGAIEGLETGLYSYLCHPDLFMRPRAKFDDKCAEISHKICEYAQNNNILLEYNLEGLKNTDSGFNVHYPNDNFWKIASEYDICAIIGCDAHSPESLRDDRYYSKAIKYLSDLNIKVTDTLPRKF